METQKLLSLAEASKILGVSIWTLRRWIWERRIPSHKLGGRRLLNEVDIRRMIQNSREEIK